ncbi:hypothetical protein BDD43_3417 [Mucilaginibacter gracilis]|uniref:Uncharacterized protein n=1 Tax=Mucilaginibacter gracilis TaxID=423350 RepID=A0A495J2L1_9SPHI|nr:hypothetical protein [Mucilaginibacter gracilis]RKR83215.1 hypothetical protein BDD43_3417 [Mucilaginibacter gracilis]
MSTATTEIKPLSKDAIVSRCLNMVTDNQYSLLNTKNPKEIRRFEYNVAFYGGIAKYLTEVQEPKVININIQHLVKEIVTTNFASVDAERELTEMLLRVVKNAEANI